MEPQHSRLSHTLGPIKQLAFVPQDFEASIKYWTEIMGVGPFFYLEHISLEDVFYRGEQIEYDCSAAIAFWGDMEIELLRQHNEGPSILMDFIEAGREDLHHMRLGVDDLQGARDQLEAMGGKLIQSAILPGSGAYFMMEMPGPGPIIELSMLEPRFEKLWAYMKKAADTWDGTDPLRAIPPEAEWLV